MRMAIASLISERKRTMPKYIDAEALKAAVSAYCNKTKPYSTISVMGLIPDVLIHDVLDIIDAAPAADMVEVVRCRDCVCMGKRPPLLEGYREDCGWCMQHGRVVLPEDFCSDGERMEEE